jgi:hypothetical protein
MTDDAVKSTRGRGRPRLQAEPCTIRIGVPLTAADHQALVSLVKTQQCVDPKVSKQEVIRQLIRECASRENNAHHTDAPQAQ